MTSRAIQKIFHTSNKRMLRVTEGRTKNETHIFIPYRGSMLTHFASNSHKNSRGKIGITPIESKGRTVNKNS